MKQSLCLATLFFCIVLKTLGQVCFPVFSQTNDVYKGKIYNQSFGGPIPITLWEKETKSNEVTRVAGILIVPNFYTKGISRFKNKELMINTVNNDLVLGTDNLDKYKNSNLMTSSSGLGFGFYAGSVFERSGINNEESIAYDLNIPRQGIFIWGNYEHFWNVETAMGYMVKGKIFNKTKYDKSNINNFVNRNRFTANIEAGYKFLWLRVAYSPNVFKTESIPPFEKTRIAIGLNLLNFL